jgi:hypothetical protein
MNAEGRFKFGSIDDETKAEIKQWLDSDVSADMGQVKRVSI